MNELLWKLSDCEFIKIVTESGFDFEKTDFCCDEVQAYFVNLQLLCIGEQTAGLFFEDSIKNLKKVINNKLQLHESIIKNLGIMENEYCHEFSHGKSGFVMVSTSDGSSEYWIGSNYEIWKTYNTTTPMATTWLYNDHDGNIIFEVTPLYKWSFFPDDAEDPNFITYDEFMKNYQPLIRRVVSREVALVWLEQTIQVYRSLFKNEEDYKRAYDSMNW